MARRLPLLAPLALLALAPLSAAGGFGPAISTPPPQIVEKWGPNKPNVRVSVGHLTFAGKPVAGAVVKVDEYTEPPTAADGSFGYEVDSTLIGRHRITVSDVSQATVGGKAATGQQRAALLRAHGAITVAYALRDLRAARTAGGIEVTGRLAFADGSAPPPVVLYSYRLSGRVVDADGKPVVGARVSTRTLDRDFWTVSSPTDADGRYESLFTASSEVPGNPVAFTVRVALGDRVYEFLRSEYVYFQRLQSARLGIELPPANHPIAIPRPVSYSGAIYEGLLVGALAEGKVVHPLAASWPDAKGRFRLVLPAALRGRTVSFWESTAQLFSRSAGRPGGAVELGGWPVSLPPSAPTGVATVRLPG